MIGILIVATSAVFSNANMTLPDVQNPSGPAPWSGPVRYIGSSGGNALLLSPPDRGEPGKPTIWQWTLLTEPDGTSPIDQHGRRLGFNVAAMNYRIDCAARTRQVIYFQAYAWDADEGANPRVVLSQSSAAEAQPTTPNGPGDMIVKAACDPTARGPRDTNDYSSVDVAMFYHSF